ncbi:MAG: quaternary ammonium compound efflux SMR transporter SugE [Candidatus Kapaibacterium sp.]
MAWFILIIAGLLEVGWAIGLKYSEGFSKPIPSILTVIGMILSFYLLSISLKTLPVGTAYSIWTGIGAIGTAILGMVLFHEPRDMARLVCMLLIVAGILGLKLTST